MLLCLLFAIAWGAGFATAEPRGESSADVTDVLRDHRQPTRDETTERLLLSSDVACLGRILRVNPGPSDSITPRTYAEVVYEPVEFVKGALDFDDSLSVSIAPDAHDTVNRLRTAARESGAGFLLFFYDAGGYWRLVSLPAWELDSGSGFVRVAPGRWGDELAHVRALADGISLEGLTRRATRIVVGTSRVDSTAHRDGPAVPVARHLVDVAETLKGPQATGALPVRSFYPLPPGRQLWFLVPGERGIEESIPYAAPSYRPMRPDSTRVPEVTDAEIAQVASLVRAHKERAPSKPR